MNAIELLKSDHETVARLFERYLAGGVPDVLQEIVKELSIHAAIEEQYLYPLVRKSLPDGDSLADEGIAEHQTVKELLVELDGLSQRRADIDAKVATLKKNIEHHVSEEETEMFPKLEKHCPSDALEDLGQTLQSAKKMAPTHPHPNAPATPPGNKIAGPVAAAIDRARDALSGKG